MANCFKVVYSILPVGADVGTSIAWFVCVFLSWLHHYWYRVAGFWKSMRLVVAKVARALRGYLVSTTAHGRKAGESGVWIGIKPVVRPACVPKIR